VTPSEPANVVPDNTTEQEATEFFNTADANQDGFLTKEEVKITFRNLGLSISDRELYTVFKKADTDGDDKLSIEELKTFLVPLYKKPEEPIPPTDPVTPPAENAT